MPTTVQPNQPYRGRVSVAASPTTATASGTSSAFAMCGCVSSRTSQSAPNTGPTSNRLPTPWTASTTGNGTSTISDPASGTRGTAYHRGGAAEDATAHTTAEPA